MLHAACCMLLLLLLLLLRLHAAAASMKLQLLIVNGLTFTACPELEKAAFSGDSSTAGTMCHR
jgi:hypothetical protein